MYERELLDKFAQAAITGLLTQERLHGHERQAAAMAYQIAEYLLIERRRLHDKRATEANK